MAASPGPGEGSRPLELKRVPLTRASIPPSLGFNSDKHAIYLILLVRKRTQTKPRRDQERYLIVLSFGFILARDKRVSRFINHREIERVFVQLIPQPGTTHVTPQIIIKFIPQAQEPTQVLLVLQKDNVKLCPKLKDDPLYPLHVLNSVRYELCKVGIPADLIDPSVDPFDHPDRFGYVDKKKYPGFIPPKIKQARRSAETAPSILGWASPTASSYQGTSAASFSPRSPTHNKPTHSEAPSSPPPARPDLYRANSPLWGGSAASPVNQQGSPSPIPQSPVEKVDTSVKSNEDHIDVDTPPPPVMPSPRQSLWIKLSAAEMELGDAAPLPAAKAGAGVRGSYELTLRPTAQQNERIAQSVKVDGLLQPLPLRTSWDVEKWMPIEVEQYQSLIFEVSRTWGGEGSGDMVGAAEVPVRDLLPPKRTGMSTAWKDGLPLMKGTKVVGRLRLRAARDFPLSSGMPRPPPSSPDDAPPANLSPASMEDSRHGGDSSDEAADGEVYECTTHTLCHNLRSSPSLDATVTGTIARGESVLFHHILYDEGTGALWGVCFVGAERSFTLIKSSGGVYYYAPRRVLQSSRVSATAASLGIAALAVAASWRDPFSIDTILRDIGVLHQELEVKARYDLEPPRATDEGKRVGTADAGIQAETSPPRVSFSNPSGFVDETEDGGTERFPTVDDDSIILKISVLGDADSVRNGSISLSALETPPLPPPAHPPPPPPPLPPPPKIKTPAADPEEQIPLSFAAMHFAGLRSPERPRPRRSSSRLLSPRRPSVHAPRPF